MFYPLNTCININNKMKMFSKNISAFHLFILLAHCDPQTEHFENKGVNGGGDETTAYVNGFKLHVYTFVCLDIFKVG